MEVDEATRSSTPRVGHLPVHKEQSGDRWLYVLGVNKRSGNKYSSLRDMVEAQKQINSVFQFKYNYQP
jgi:hypothetical protein